MGTRPLSRELFIVSAKRTAFGTYGGLLKDLTATDLALHAASAALAEGNVRPEQIDQVIVGNVQQTSADSIYCARHVGLRAGVPIEVPALTLNRLCGSGFQAVVSAAEQIELGEAEMILCGGTESMSQAPHTIRGARWGLPFGKPGQVGDMLWDALYDTYAGMPMAMTAENLAELHQLSRQECDAYGLRSQKAWAAAHEAGHFAAEIAPISLKSKKGEVLFDKDEHPRPQTTPEALAKLPPVFKKEGVVTAGNASGLADGAAMLVVASGDAVKKHNLKPIARLVQWGVAGVDPKTMGIGPVPAIRTALARAGRALAEMDLIEVNEAFAAQYLAVERELGLPRERTNVSGGAIALGHPLGASGARITTHLAHAFARTSAKLAVGSACIGGGQGIAVILAAV